MTADRRHLRALAVLVFIHTAACSGEVGDSCGSRCTDASRLGDGGERRDAASDAGPTTDALEQPDTAPATDAASAPDAHATGRGCGADLLRCDDFERTDVGDAWGLDSYDGTATIDTTRAASGPRALHVHTLSHGGARAVLSDMSSFPVPGNSFYGRAFVFLEGTVPDGHAGVFNARGTLPGGGDVEFRLGIGHGALEPNYSGPGNEYGIWTPSPPPMPADRWTCIEWYYGDDPGDADQLHYWIDGIEQVDHGVYGATPSLWTAPSYATFSFGLLLYHDEPGAGFDLWFDAVALSSARIGCGD